MPGIKILLAEDEPQIARLIQFKLQREGFDIVWTDNGVRAWKSIQADKPDLILLDVMMPIMDGFEVLEKIKADANFKDIPVVMLTAKGQERDIDRGKELGADKYITKPFNPSELVEEIRQIIETAKL